MSYENGMSALNLEMPDEVPRTEYSVENHWDAISAVTGMEVKSDSEYETKLAAMRAFFKEWDYGLLWSVLVSNQYMNGKKTSMGHAKYASEGEDFNTHVFCPFEEPEDVIDFDPLQEYGEFSVPKMIDDFNTHYRNNIKLYSDCVNMTGIYITCMSGLIEIFGWDMLLLAAGFDPKAFGEMTNRYCEWIKPCFEALAQSEAPVVMIHDDIVWTEGAFLAPAWYREFVFPNYKKLFEPLIDSKKKIIFTSDGNYTEFIDDIASCGVNGFVLEPLTDMQYIADKYGKTHSFIGNADTRIILQGSKEDIYNEVKRCMDIGKKCPGFIMAVGNHIPANTPVDNVLYYDEAYKKLRKR